MSKNRPFWKLSPLLCDVTVSTIIGDLRSHQNLERLVLARPRLGAYWEGSFYCFRVGIIVADGQDGENQNGNAGKKYAYY